MGAQENGLTLEVLAHKPETLERENAELRQEVAVLRGSGTGQDALPALRGLGYAPGAGCHV
jgi:hypothetical protein